MVLDFIEILKVIFLGIVEGITEWLPISSTGHMILVDEFITLNMSEAFKEMFFVVIQLGAILAVVVMFWNKMFPFQFKNKAQSIVKKDTFSLWFKVAVACVPSAIMGILFDDYLDAYLQTPIVISIMLIFYGLLSRLLFRKIKRFRLITRYIPFREPKFSQSMTLIPSCLAISKGSLEPQRFTSFSPTRESCSAFIIPPPVYSIAKSVYDKYH